MKREEEKQVRRRYDADFKAQLLELHSNGRSISSLADSFGVDKNLLYRWKREALNSQSSVSQEHLQEIKRLRKELKAVEQERDILKKALSIFSRHP